MSPPAIETLVFDLGGVVIDWDPLAYVCTQDWNVAQDAGRPFAAAVAELQARYPEQGELIAAFWERWEEMVPGPIPGAPDLLRELHAGGVPLYALSNWSAETWPRIAGRFDFWPCFRGVVLSGRVRVAKPDAAIYEHLFAAHGIEPGRALFIDDSEANVAGARAVGMQALRFESVPRLRAELREFGIDVADA